MFSVLVKYSNIIFNQVLKNFYFINLQFINFKIALSLNGWLFLVETKTSPVGRLYDTMTDEAKKPKNKYYSVSMVNFASLDSNVERPPPLCFNTTMPQDTIDKAIETSASASIDLMHERMKIDQTILGRMRELGYGCEGQTGMQKINFLTSLHKIIPEIKVMVVVMSIIPFTIDSNSKMTCV